MGNKLTPEQIDKMDGPALSRFVAVEVMKWREGEYNPGKWYPHEDYNQLHRVIAKLRSEQLRALSKIIAMKLARIVPHINYPNIAIGALTLEPIDVLRSICEAVNECPSK